MDPSREEKDFRGAAAIFGAVFALCITMGCEGGSSSAPKGDTDTDSGSGSVADTRGTDDEDSGACRPYRTCASENLDCGVVHDGCGGFESCGACEDGQVCGASEPGRCAGCVPATCDELGLSCGVVQDGCGGTVSCGSCSEGLTCGGGGLPGQCSAPICYYSWCYQSPHPTSDDLWRVRSFDQRGVWYVGAGGVVLRQTATRGFEAVDAFTRRLTNLRDIWIIDETDGWAVGEDGAIVRYNGEIFDSRSDEGVFWNDIDEKTEVKGNLYALAVSEQKEVFAGGQGWILRFDGTAWRPELRRSDVEVRAFVQVGEKLLAVGGVGEGALQRPLVLEQGKGAWDLVDLGEADVPGARIHAAKVSPAGELWFAGAGLDGDGKVAGPYCAMGGVDNLELLDLPGAGAVEDIAFDESGRAWLAGLGGTVIVASKDAKEFFSAPPIFGHEGALSFESAEEALVVSGANGIVGRRESGMWTVNVAEPGIFGDKKAIVKELSPQAVWALAPGLVAHFDGVTWRLEAIEGDPVDVFALSRDAVWVVANVEGDASGIIAHHYDGSAWSRTRLESETAATLSGTSGTDVRVETTSGQVWHFDGEGWTLHGSPDFPSSPGAYSLQASKSWELSKGGGFVRIDSETRTQTLAWPYAGLRGEVHDAWGDGEAIYAVGEDGAIVGDGETWRRLASDVSLRAVHGSAPAGVWFVGEKDGEPAVYRLVDGALERVTFEAGPGETLGEVAVTGETVFVAGQALYRREEGTWRQIAVADSGSFAGLVALGSDEVMVGDGDELDTWSGGVWTSAPAFDLLDQRVIADESRVLIDGGFIIDRDTVAFTGTTPSRYNAALIVCDFGICGGNVLFSYNEAVFTAIWARSAEEIYVSMSELGYVYEYMHSVRMFISVDPTTDDPLEALWGDEDEMWGFARDGVILHETQ